MAKILLADPRVDAVDLDNEAIKTAGMLGFVDIFSLLITSCKRQYVATK
ncbi:unnamed protein product [uncultured virus]|nr:unnamed protein product [uncultured virus]